MKIREKTVQKESAFEQFFLISEQEVSVGKGV